MITSQIIFFTLLASSPVTFAWDVAVAVGDQVQLLNASGSLEGSLSEGMREVHALAYNQDLSTLYFGDNERPDGSIFQLRLPDHDRLTTDNATVTVFTIVNKQAYPVKGVAYDDMTGILYWSTALGHEIRWASLQATDTPQTGQPLLTDSRQIPMGLAIDICKRYLYWSNCGEPASIERSLLDGSERRTLIREDLVRPYAVVVDQATDRLYWVDERHGFTFRIESADQNGRDRKVVVEGSDHQPFALAVSAGSVFWADHIHRSVWRKSLAESVSSAREEPILVASYDLSPLALASAHPGVWTHDRCAPVIQPTMKVIPATITKASTVEALGLPVNVSANHVCLHDGLWMVDAGYCDCLPGYSGAFCEVDECLDYCVHGSCQPGRVCQCHEGYSGPRCEVSVCHNYCVTGSCTVDLTGQPQCHCEDGYSGQRCEVNFTQLKELQDSLAEVCQTYCSLWAQSEDTVQPLQACRCTEETEWSRDYARLAVYGLVGLLVVTLLLMTYKMLKMRSGPRIRKRIVVNKSRPASCGPEPERQCEITIENCCNMNICETPCFEPDLRQPEPKAGRGGREEKKTLLGNMELPPDDLY